MTNFNPINFLNNFINTAQNKVQDGTFNVENSSSQAQNVPEKYSTSQDFVPKLFVGKTPFKPMEFSETARLVKELMNLPKELKEFLQSEIKQIQGKLILENLKDTSVLQKLNVAQLMLFLGENSKAANQKLIQIIAEISRNQGGEIKQLKEIMAMFSSVSNPANITQEANQTLKNLLLLYLPWVPLRENKEDNLDFDIDFEEEKTNEQKGETSQSVNVIIQTKNYGVVKAILELNSPNNLTTLIYCNDDFPKQMLEKLLYKEAKEINLNSTFVSQTISSKDSKKENVQINAQNNINSYLLLITYSLIRLVIGFDKTLPSSN